jgi:hypothetical protein
MTFIEDGVTVEGRPLNAGEKAERKLWAEEVVFAEQLEAETLATKLAARETAYEKLSGWGLTPDEIAAIIPA